VQYCIYISTPLGGGVEIRRLVNQNRVTNAVFSTFYLFIQQLFYMLHADVVRTSGYVCIRIPAPPPSDVVDVEVDGKRFRAKYLKKRVRSGGREYVYHYLALGSSIEMFQLLGRRLEVRLLATATSAAAVKAVASTAELPAFPRQYLMLPCTDKIMKLLELAGGCVDMRTSDVGMTVMCAASTIKAALKKLQEEGKIVEEGWRICLR
jgi:hypothetical protein